MSLVTKLSVYTHCNDLGGKVWNPAIKWTKKFAVFVVLENDSGVTGLGECWCFDTAPDALVAFLRTEVAPHIVGCRCDDYPAIYKKLVNAATLTARHGMLASALSGVDIAMWDMQSRLSDQPLWAYLHSASKRSSAADGSMQVYGSGGLYGENKTTAHLVTEMNSMRDSGFSIVKMKIGALSVADDLERVLAVLDGLGDSIKLIIDGVYSYSVEDALEVYGALPASRIEAFQSPIKASDITGMQALCTAGVPVMGTEAEYRDEIHQQLIEQRAVKYLQTAPVACGGFTRLNDLSATLSLEVSSTAIALAAACHYAAANDRVAHTEYHYVHQVFMDELALEAVPGRNGWFQLPDKPGLGVTLPLSMVDVQFELAFSG